MNVRKRSERRLLTHLAKPDRKTTNISTGGKSDLIIAMAIVLVFAITWLLFAFTYRCGTLLHILILSGTVSSALGWAVGIAISPYNSSERSSFDHISKIVYGFLSGYILSKVDDTISNIFRFESITKISEECLVILAYSIASFLVTACATYITRSYWDTDKDKSAQ